MSTPSQRPPQSYQNKGPPEGWNDCPIAPSNVIKPKRRPVHLSHLDLLNGTSPTPSPTPSSTSISTTLYKSPTPPTPPTPPKIAK